MTNTHKISKKYGWKRDKVDVRDKVMRFKAVDLSTLPPKVDLRDKCSPVEDQASLGSCTANATAGALEYLENKVGSGSFENFSRLFVYYNTRVLGKTVHEDSGGSLRDSVKSVVRVGACDELIWAYDISKFTIRPSLACYRNAKPHKIVDYHRIDGGLSDLLQCLAEGYPFVFGFSVFSEFEGPQVASTGVLNLPAPDETFQGGHAVCAVGYDMDAKTVLVRNSWGSNWGQGGYFTMPFAYISNPNLASDFWTLRK